MAGQAARQQRKTPPTVEAIARYWAEHEVPGVSEWIHLARLRVDPAEPVCMACGWWDERRSPGKGLERAHVVPHAIGGANEPFNFALLCPDCHRESPDTKHPLTFWTWVSTCPDDRDPLRSDQRRAETIAGQLTADEIDALNAIPDGQLAPLLAVVADQLRPVMHAGRWSVGTTAELLRGAGRAFKDRADPQTRLF